MMLSEPCFPPDRPPHNYLNPTFGLIVASSFDKHVIIGRADVPSKRAGAAVLCVLGAQIDDGGACASRRDDVSNVRRKLPRCMLMRASRVDLGLSVRIDRCRRWRPSLSRLSDNSLLPRDSTDADLPKRVVPRPLLTTFSTRTQLCTFCSSFPG